jgi:cytochrome c556
MTRISGGSAVWLLAAVAAGGAASLVDGGADERDALMREKLELAQKVLAGLAKSDLEAAGSDAAALAALTREARWRIRETPEYLSRSAEFERSASTLAAMASNKNAEGAALAWVQMSTQCFDCHRWVRGSKDGK